MNANQLESSLQSRALAAALRKSNFSVYRVTESEAILANAQLVRETLRPVSGLGEEFGYNSQSVQYVEGWIERQRVRPDVTPENIRSWVQVLGSFLGECVIHIYGGEWRLQDGQWGVFFDERNGVYPFSKVAKQFANGVESDSIVGFVQTIGPVFKDKLKKGSGA